MLDPEHPPFPPTGLSLVPKAIIGRFGNCRTSWKIPKQDLNSKWPVRQILVQANHSPTSCVNHWHDEYD